MSRSELTYPFWMLVYRDGPGWRPVVIDPGYATAFSTSAGALAFLTGRGKPEWEFRLVCRPTLLRVLGEFRQQGVRGVALDPTIEVGGVRVDFDHLAGGAA